MSMLQDVHPTHQNNFVNYIIDRTYNIALDDLAGKGKISGRELVNIVFGSSGKKLTKSVFSLLWQSMPSMGDGEAFLSILLDKGRKPVGKFEKGDLLYDNTLEIEVKGQSGRLMGQMGYSGVTTVVNKLKTNLRYVLKQLNEETEYVIPSNGLEFNVSKLKPGAYFDMIKQAVKDRGHPLTHDEKVLVSAGYIQCINVLLETAFITDTLLVDIINDSCTFDKSSLLDLNIVLLKQFFRYYHQLEKFDYFCIINSKTNELLIDDAITFENNLESYIRNNIINIVCCPSFSNAGGSQGKTYAISLK